MDAGGAEGREDTGAGGGGLEASEKYKDYSPTVGALFGGLAGCIKVLQTELKE